MAWACLDDQAWQNVKLIGVGGPARALYWNAISWASDHGTDGRVPDAVLPLLAPDVAMGLVAERVGGRWQAVSIAGLRQRLLDAGLFEPGEQGVLIHDFRVYNPTSDEVAERRQAKAEVLAERRARGYAKVAGQRGEHGRFTAAEPPLPAHARTHEAVPDDRYAHAGAHEAAEITATGAGAQVAVDSPLTPDPGSPERDETNRDSAGAGAREDEPFFPDPDPGDDVQRHADDEHEPQHPFGRSAPARRPASADELAELRGHFGRAFGADGESAFRESWGRAMTMRPNADAQFVNDWLARDLSRFEARKLPPPTQPAIGGLVVHAVMSDADRYRAQMAVEAEAEKQQRRELIAACERQGLAVPDGLRASVAS